MLSVVGEAGSERLYIADKSVPTPCSAIISNGCEGPFMFSLYALGQYMRCGNLSRCAGGLVDESYSGKGGILSSGSEHLV